LDAERVGGNNARARGGGCVDRVACGRRCCRDTVPSVHSRDDSAHRVHRGSECTSLHCAHHACICCASCSTVMHIHTIHTHTCTLAHARIQTPTPFYSHHSHLLTQVAHTRLFFIRSHPLAGLLQSTSHSFSNFPIHLLNLHSHHLTNNISLSDVRSRRSIDGTEHPK